MKIITLTTDFGIKDWFVGSMKGIILKINPQANIVDISHSISDFNIKEAAFIIKNFYRHFPLNTIHCIVVDPGVGSNRKIIIVQTESYYFVAPDNGILSYILAEEKILKIIEVSSPKYIFETVSSTFHGRDIFAPVSANLSKNINIKEFGPAIKKIKNLPISSPIFGKEKIKGNIVFIDKFGNIILNISLQNLKEHIKIPNNGSLKLKIGSKTYPLRIVKSYSSGKEKELLLLEGSSNFLEIAIKEHSAKDLLKINSKTTIELIAST